MLSVLEMSGDSRISVTRTEGLSLTNRTLPLLSEVRCRSGKCLEIPVSVLQER